MFALRHALLAPLCNLGESVELITSRVAVRASLSASTLVVTKEAIRDFFTASPATQKLASSSWSGGLARKSVAALPNIHHTINFTLRDATTRLEWAHR